jgi:Raf kinase inhibitor-like YbhB/YbcL family protein
MALTLDSEAFDDGGGIPAKYTCSGEDISPPLHWSGVPANARSLVLIVDDPDAPDPQAPKMTWVHWLVFNIPPQTTKLPANAAAVGLPLGAHHGRNDWGRGDYGGPCPPIGQHRYFHKLYALDTELEGLNTPTKSKLEAAMQGHIIAEATLIGTFQK